MKKVLFTVVLLLCVTVAVNAQSGQMAVGGGIVVAMPMGDFGDEAGMGFGATVRGEYALNKQMSIVADIGYITYGEEELFNISYSYSQIPIMAGVKYYFNNGFYGIGQLGIHMFSFDMDVPSETYMGITVGGGSSSSSTSEFGLNIGGGYEAKVGNMILDLSAQYGMISDANQLLLRAGLKFPLK
ncbi:MAG: outer membrane beta-barrel protein [Melioribacteraceae bacterium]|nr:outer membrane beta-barrel protein [Melioribacteraceae bacterium]